MLQQYLDNPSQLLGFIVLLMNFLNLILLIKKNLFEEDVKKRIIINYLFKFKPIKEYFKQIEERLVLPLKYQFLSMCIGALLPFLVSYFYSYIYTYESILKPLPELSLIAVFILYTLATIISSILKDYPRQTIFWLLRSLSFSISGTLFLLAILFTLFAQQNEKLATSISIALFISVVFFIILEYLVVGKAEKRFKHTIEEELAILIRKKNVLTRVGTNGILVKGKLWSILDRGIMLRGKGDIFIFWDIIDWIEVIENEEQSTETPERNSETTSADASRPEINE